LFIHI